MTLRFAVLAVVVALPAFGDVCGTIAGNLVTNCGFETGDFIGWSQAGNSGFTSVETTGFNHSGSSGARLGPVGSDGMLQQILPTGPGTVSLDFWLENIDGSPNDFSVKWNGVTVFGQLVNASPFGYTEEGPINLVALGSDTLTFTFRNDPSFWGLDDISVVQTSAIPEPSSVLLLITVLGGIGVGLRRKLST